MAYTPEKLEHRHHISMNEYAVDLVLEVEDPRKIIVRAGDFRWAGRDYRLEEDEYFDIPAVDPQSQLLVYLVLTKDSKEPHVLFDFTPNDGSAFCYDFGEKSPYIQVLQLATLFIPPNKPATLKKMVGSISSIGAPKDEAGNQAG